MSWTDDPERDFERYSAEQERRQTLYDMGCIICPYCKQAIRQYEDPRCYWLNPDEALHPDCLRDMFRSMRKRFEGRDLYEDLFDLMEEAYEETQEIRTPEPEIGDY